MWAHKEKPIPVGKDFDPKVGDFSHMASEVAPIANYCDQREDSDLEYLETVHAQVVGRQRMG